LRPALSATARAITGAGSFDPLGASLTVSLTGGGGPVFTVTTVGALVNGTNFTTINYRGNNPTIRNLPYQDLIVSGSGSVAASAANPLQVFGNLTFSNNATIDAVNLSFVGSRDCLFDAGAASLNASSLTLDKTGGTGATTLTLVGSGTKDVNGNLTINRGTVDLQVSYRVTGLTTIGVNGSSGIATLRVTWQGDSDATVWSGGPVMPGSGWILHSGSERLPPADASLDLALEGSGTVRVCDGLFLTTSQDNIKLLAEEPPEDIRVLLGYAGWSAGQLAGEMAKGSWLHADIDNEILFGSPAEEMWQRFLGKMGIDPESIVQSLGVH